MEYSHNPSPGDYFIDKVGRILKIKDIIEGSVIFDNNGKEQTLSRADFNKMLKDYGFRKIDKDDNGRVNVEKLLSSNDISVSSILRLL